ncbi:amino acid synthesis family protein [Fictibacillus enclensis]|uniref:amino acid synthesis family protein n=1 Tax=Fictibacillus enclensis TaxID=1017270 RepID=UPI0025A22395|nr:amino acid synthesis family protein [Fictibacillus enclensis]MDM5200588.1 amino acid synthesis family protein [Fictibacillus enclensis]
MELEIRKIVMVSEETYIEGFKKAENPVKVAASLAVIKNPFAGRYEENLQPLIESASEKLGALLPQKAMEALGITGADVEGYGKGALVGLDGEIEHGSAIIHTLTFGNPFRTLCDNAETLLPSAEKRGSAGSSIDLAIKHKMDPKIRSHHMTFETRIPDAPRNDEIIIAAVVTASGRAHPRIGSLHKELEGIFPS